MGPRRNGSSNCWSLSPSCVSASGNGDATLAEMTYTTRYESVASIADFALRRTHLAWGIRDRARRGDAAIIGRTIGAELGWSDTDVKSAVADYEEALRLEGLVIRARLEAAWMAAPRSHETSALFHSGPISGATPCNGVARVASELQELAEFPAVSGPGTSSRRR